MNVWQGPILRRDTQQANYVWLLPPPLPDWAHSGAGKAGGIRGGMTTPWRADWREHVGKRQPPTQPKPMSRLRSEGRLVDATVQKSMMLVKFAVSKSKTCEGRKTNYCIECTMQWVATPTMGQCRQLRLALRAFRETLQVFIDFVDSLVRGLRTNVSHPPNLEH